MSVPRVAMTVDSWARLQDQREAGAQAIGMLESLLEDGDVPPCCRALAREIIDKFHGTTPQQPKKETA